MDGWPPAEDEVLLHLKRVYRTPLVLQAAFDSFEECCALISDAFPDLIHETVRDQAAILMEWQLMGASEFKRQRLSTVGDCLYRLSSVAGPSLQESFSSITRTNPLALLEMVAKRRHKKFRGDPPDARAQRFETDRKKYSLLLAGVIKSAGLPIVRLMESLEDRDASWIHLFGARRGNTLKNRYKSWKPFADWLELHRHYTFPSDVKDLIDYMQHRVDNGCGHTVPQGLSSALNLLEVLGRVPEDEQLSRDPLWLGHVKS